MPNPKANARLTEEMKLMEKMEVIEKGGKLQKVQEETAVPPIVDLEGNANANRDADEMEVVKLMKEVDLESKKQVVTQSARLKEGPLGPEHANADAVLVAVPPIQIIPAMPQDS